MKSYRFIRPGLTASLLFAPLFGCSESTPIDAPLTDEGRLAIDVAPLAFPGTTFDAIVDAQYDIVVKYSDPSAVGGWSTLTTVNDIKSSDFDNPGGALSYVAPCAVDDGPLLGTLTNQICISLTDIWVTNPVNPTGPAVLIQSVDSDFSYPSQQCQTFLCKENADVPVNFLFNILRQANQGFADISVQVEDYFCSAKYDCVEQLLVNADGDQVPTFITGLACTPGPGAVDAGVVFEHELVCKTRNGGTVSMTVGSDDPDGPNNCVDYLVDHEIYTGLETVENKWYKNTATALDPVVLAGLGGPNNPIVSCSYKAVGWVQSTEDAWTTDYKENTIALNWSVGISFLAYPCVGNVCQGGDNDGDACQNGPRDCGMNYGEIVCAGDVGSTGAVTVNGDGVGPVTSSIFTQTPKRISGDPADTNGIDRGDGILFRGFIGTNNFKVRMPVSAEGCKAEASILKGFESENQYLEKAINEANGNLKKHNEILAKATDSLTRFQAAQGSFVDLQTIVGGLTNADNWQNATDELIKAIFDGLGQTDEKLVGSINYEAIMANYKAYVEAIGEKSNDATAGAATGSAFAAGNASHLLGRQAIVDLRDGAQIRLDGFEADASALQISMEAAGTALNECNTGATESDCIALRAFEDTRELELVTGNHAALMDPAIQTYCFRNPNTNLRADITVQDQCIGLGTDGKVKNVDLLVQGIDSIGEQFLGVVTFFANEKTGRFECMKDERHYKNAQDETYAAIDAPKSAEENKAHGNRGKEGFELDQCFVQQVSAMKCMSEEGAEFFNGMTVIGNQLDFAIAQSIPFGTTALPLTDTSYGQAGQVVIYKHILSGAAKQVAVASWNGSGNTLTLGAALPAGDYSYRFFAQDFSDPGQYCSAIKQIRLGDFGGSFQVAGKRRKCDIEPKQEHNSKSAIFMEGCDAGEIPTEKEIIAVLEDEVAGEIVARANIENGAYAKEIEFKCYAEHSKAYEDSLELTEYDSEVKKELLQHFQKQLEKNKTYKLKLYTQDKSAGGDFDEATAVPALDELGAPIEAEFQMLEEVDFVRELKDAKASSTCEIK